jgi:hypothetical protein
MSTRRSIRTRSGVVEARHVPAFTALLRTMQGAEALTWATAPAMAENYRDHRAGASSGCSARARTYRRRQEALIAKGALEAAIAMDRQDLEAIARAIGVGVMLEQYGYALEYARRRPWWRR